MAQTKKSKDDTTARTGREDAVQLLKADHREVEALFKEFEEASTRRRQTIAREVCRMLTVHAQIEEEIFYPAVKQQVEEADLVNEAVVEHASAKELIAKIEAMDAGDELFAATVTVLGEMVSHHVEEEEKEMFKQAKAAKVDMVDLGVQLALRKNELQAQMKEMATA